MGRRLGRPDSELYRGVRLAKALQWRQDAAPDLTATEADFLTASERLSAAELHAAEDRARQQIRVNRRLRAALTTAAVLLVGALIAGFLAAGQAGRADRQATPRNRQPWPQTPAAPARRPWCESDIDTSLLLAVAGVRMKESPESRANLLAALAKHPQLIQLDRDREAGFLRLEVTADGRRALRVRPPTAMCSLYDLTTGATARRAQAAKNRLSGADHLDSVDRSR